MNPQPIQTELFQVPATVVHGVQTEVKCPESVTLAQAVAPIVPTQLTLDLHKVLA